MDDESHSQETESKILEGAKVATRRRRVTRACDMCRRKKIKCDGLRPCKNCKAGKLECTYHMPSSRKSSFSPEYVENLESRVRYLETLLKKNTNFDLSSNSPSFLFFLREQKFQATNELENMSPERKVIFTSMINYGNLFVDAKHGTRYFRGGSSIHVLIQHLIRRLPGDFEICEPYSAYPLGNKNIQFDDNDPEYQFFTPTPRFSIDFMVSSVDPREIQLPGIEEALCITKAAVSYVSGIVFYTTYADFPKKIRLLYSGNYQGNFFPLFLSILCVGYYHHLLNNPSNTELQSLIKKYSFYSERLVKSVDNFTIESIQCLLILSIYRYCRTEISAAWYYMKLGLNCCLRLGLHRNITEGFTEEQIDSRRRIFWAIYCYDRQLCTLFGFPLGVRDEDIDQCLPVTPKFPSVTEIEANARLFFFHGVKLYKISSRILTKLYSPNSRNVTKKHISYAVIQDLEQLLDGFYNSLPRVFRAEQPGEFQANHFFYNLQLVYYSFRMLIYRPLLHYLEADSPAMQALKVPDRQTAFTLACKCVDSAIVCVQNLSHLSKGLKRTLDRYYWTTVYCGFSTIVTLIFAALLTKNTNLLIHISVARESIEALAHECVTRRLLPLIDKMRESLMKILESNADGYKQMSPTKAPQVFESESNVPINNGPQQSIDKESNSNTQLPQVETEGQQQSVFDGNIGTIPYQAYNMNEDSFIDINTLSSMLNYHTQAVSIHHPSFYISRSDVPLEEEFQIPNELLAVDPVAESMQENSDIINEAFGLVDPDVSDGKSRESSSLNNSTPFNPTVNIDPASILEHFSQNVMKDSQNS
ncbi:Membrane-tethered transcription factor [Schizosaccharomyces pombe]